MAMRLIRTGLRPASILIGGAFLHQGPRLSRWPRVGARGHLRLSTHTILLRVGVIALCLGSVSFVCSATTIVRHNALLGQPFGHLTSLPSLAIGVGADAPSVLGFPGYCCPEQGR